MRVPLHSSCAPAPVRGLFFVSKLNNLYYHDMRLSQAFNLSQGYTWVYSATNSLASGGVDTTRFITGDLPVAFFRAYLATDGTRGALFELYVGGDIQFGQPVQGYPLNHENAQPEPFSLIEDSSFVTTPGTKIGEASIGDGVLEGVVGSAGPALWVFAPNQQYYINVTNLHQQTAALDLELTVGAVGKAGGI